MEPMRTGRVESDRIVDAAACLVDAAGCLVDGADQLG